MRSLGGKERERVLVFERVRIGWDGMDGAEGKWKEGFHTIVVCILVGMKENILGVSVDY